MMTKPFLFPIVTETALAIPRAQHELRTFLINPLLRPELAGHRETQFELFVGSEGWKLSEDRFILETEAVQTTRQRFFHVL